MFKNVSQKTPGVEASFVDPPHTSVSDIFCVMETHPERGKWIYPIKEDFNHYLALDILTCGVSDTPTEKSLGVIIGASPSETGLWQISFVVKGLVPIAVHKDTLLPYTDNGWRIHILREPQKIHQETLNETKKDKNGVTVTNPVLWELTRNDIEMTVAHIRHNPNNHLLKEP